MQNGSPQEIPQKIPDFSKEDYLVTDKPYVWLHSHGKNPFLLKQLMNRMNDAARARGIRNLATLYRLFLDTLPEDEKAVDQYTDFVGQDISLACNGWIADEDGVRGRDKYGFEVVACYHPIMPVQRLINIDTNVYKVRLAYRPGDVWKYSIEDRTTIADSRSIISLAKHGVAVNSETAKTLVKYLSDVEQQNYSAIPEIPCVGRLGWIDGYGFSPYMKGLEFDGEDGYRARFESLHPKGSREKWMECVLQARKSKARGSVVFRIVLAASFASVLVKPTQCRPFFVHLWGGSGTGKTISMQVGASIWADPEIGKYIQTFNSTSVAYELGAAFCNSLPFMLDEFQIKDAGKQQDFDQLIYQLTEGAGKNRGSKNISVRETLRWQNCTISTGENPIITPQSKEGAMNRTLEICCEDLPMFDNPRRTLLTVSDNFGFVGREFIERLTEMGFDKLKELFEEQHAAIRADDTMDKQTSSAALVLTADALAEEWIFHDGVRLKPSDIAPYIVSKETMNQNSRALTYIHDVVAMNQTKFTPGKDNYTGEIWGKMGTSESDEGYVYIIKSKFDQILSEKGFNASAFLGWARRNGYVALDAGGKSTVATRINQTVRRCVKLKLAEEAFEELGSVDEEELPF